MDKEKVIVLTIPPEKVLKRLAASIGEQPSIIDDLFGYKDDNQFGGTIRDDSFSIFPRKYVLTKKGPLRAILHGKIEELPSGSKLRITSSGGVSRKIAVPVLIGSFAFLVLAGTNITALLIAYPLAIAIYLPINYQLDKQEESLLSFLHNLLRGDIVESKTNID